MLITVIVTAVTDAESEATNQVWVHFAHTFHFAMAVGFDVFGQMCHGGIIGRYCRFEHHMVNAMMLSVHIPIDKDDHAQLVLAVIFQEKTEKTCVEGGGFGVET